MRLSAATFRRLCLRFGGASQFFRRDWRGREPLARNESTVSSLRETIDAKAILEEV